MFETLTVASIMAALTSLIGGGLATAIISQEVIQKILGLQKAEKPYSERLLELTQKLESASSEVDEVLKEIALVADKRQNTVEKLESELAVLETKESELKVRISALENTPVEAAKHFAELISAGEKRGARRDYLLFGGGVLVTTAISLGIQFFAG